jgi:diguanylate cyclase (GGDEF)-like protein
LREAVAIVTEIVNRAKTAWGRFAIEVGLVVLLFLSAVFTGLFASNKRLIEAELETRARAHFKSIVLTRSWNARYGGVYVEKKPGIESNPYLKNPDILGADGKVYTKKNPALMTREISEMSAQEGDFQFHITSLKLLNPNNTPDPFERQALVEFEKGEKEVFAKVAQEGKTYFRYMAPLFIEQSCLPCHDHQNYKVGDVRGGISVSFSIDDVERALFRNGSFTIASFVLTCGLLLTIIFRSVVKLRSKLVEAENLIREMAVTDELTRLKNRRYLLSRLAEEHLRARRYGSRIGCIMCDIDHFKLINDRFGHEAGDIVLKNFAGLLDHYCRGGDLVGRWGGEEFMILLPEADIQSALAVAEKLRSATAQLEVYFTEQNMIGITASFGVACLDGKGSNVPEDELALVRAADKALYKAKYAGRNRVEQETVSE